MATTVNMLDAKTNLSKLVEAVETGVETEIVIARNGRPAAKLVPLGTRQRRRIGLHDGEYPDISLEELNADDEEIARMFHGDDPAAVGAEAGRRKVRNR